MVSRGSNTKEAVDILLDIADVGRCGFAHGTVNVADAKTEAGVRKVDLSLMLRDELLAWRASLDAPTPESPFFPTWARRRRDEDNIHARVGPAGCPMRQRTPGAASDASAARGG